jgi:hypothetical protein
MVIEESGAPAGSRELALILPGLAAAVRCAGKALGRLPALEALLARADRPEDHGADPVAQVEHALAARAGAAKLPRGPLSRLGDGGVLDAAWWARADPVHLALMQDHVRIVPEIDVAVAEAQALAASCDEALAAHALCLVTPVPERWYLRSERPLHFDAQPADAIAGEDLYPFLPAGPDGAYLRRVLTEVQMTLHGHAVNVARERGGRPSVNGLWLWGGGMLGAAPAPIALPDLRSDDPVARGLWRYAGATADALPEAAAPAVTGILCTRAFERAARRADAAACGALLDRLDAEWLGPALRGLRAGRIERIRLLPGAGACHVLDRRALARWWRRVKPAGVLAGRL